MELVYAREGQTLKGGQTQRNPRYFAGPEEGVSSVILVGDWPEIESAYLARGVAVSHQGRPNPEPAPAAPVGNVKKARRPSATGA
jgi:hypothetical protein